MSGFCPPANFQPSPSAYREPSFGHGTLDILNATHAYWQWHRNQVRPWLFLEFVGPTAISRPPQDFKLLTGSSLRAGACRLILMGQHVATLHGICSSTLESRSRRLHIDQGDEQDLLNVLPTLGLCANQLSPPLVGPRPSLTRHCRRYLVQQIQLGPAVSCRRPKLFFFWRRGLS